MRYSQKKNTLVEVMQCCMSVVVLTVLILAMPSHISHRFSCSSWIWLLALSSLWVSLASAIGMCILHAISSMMAQQWFLGHRVQWAGWRGFLGTSERRSRPKTESPTNASEVHEKQLGSSSSTERPPGQTLGSWVCGADRAGNKLVAHFGRCVEIPEASRFLPAPRAGPALLFGRIQRRENAADGSGRHDHGASDGRSQCAGREGGFQVAWWLWYWRPNGPFCLGSEDLPALRAMDARASILMTRLKDEAEKENARCLQEVAWSQKRYTKSLSNIETALESRE